MKILGLFIAVCVLMLAVLAWHVFSGGVFHSGPKVESTPRTEPDHGPAIPRPGPDMQSGPDSRPYEPPASQASVRWGTDPAIEAARQRVAGAARVLQEEPDHVSALRDLAGGLVTLGRWQEAANTLARLVELEPDDIALRFEQATALIQARRWIEALAALKVVVERSPEDGRAWFDLALCHQAVGHLAEARAAWDRTIGLQASPAALARRGEVLLDMQEWSAAAADFERVLEQEPDTADATLNLSLALRKLGRSDEARERLLRYIEGHPRHVPVLNRLAAIAWEQCQEAPTEQRAACDDAVRWCGRSLECDPQQADVRELLEAAIRAGGTAAEGALAH